MEARCNWIAADIGRIPVGLVGEGIAPDCAETDHNSVAVLARSSVGRDWEIHKYSVVVEHRGLAGMVAHSSPAEEEKTVGSSRLVHHTSPALVHRSLVRQEAWSWIHPLCRTPRQ